MGHFLNHAPWLTQVRYSLYHSQMMMRDRSQLYPKRTSLVLLDDDDYWGNSYQSRTPLKRDVIADLLDKLDSLGVSTVALDMDLRSPRPDDPNFEYADYKVEDAKLIAAIGADVCRRPSCCAGFFDSVWDGRLLGDAIDLHREAAAVAVCEARVHSIALRHATDCRNAAPGEWRHAGLNVARGHRDCRPDSEGRFLGIYRTGLSRFSEYLGEADFGPKNGRQFIFSGNQIMKTDPAALKDQLADKLVFVGAKWHANAYGVGPLVDQHNSPGGMEPGVMLHANYVEAMLDRTGTFAPVSDSTAEMIEIGLVLALALIGLLEIHTMWKWAAFAIGLIL